MKKLHEMLGLKSHSTISKWRHGLQDVPAKYAKQLEDITGINRLCFLYPEEFGSPWNQVKMLNKHKIITNKNKHNG